jgi:tripartite-type tricarboxylate transporter receptor subunit TctC
MKASVYHEQNLEGNRVVRKRSTLISAIAAACFCALATASGISAQPYPSKPVTILIPFAAGGATDITARVIAEVATEKLGRRVLVENRPGAGGGLMTAQLARAAPDGYTLGALTASPVIVRPHVVADAGYDSAKDLTFIARYLLAPQPIAVPTDSPYKTYADLIAYARRTRAACATRRSRPVAARMSSSTQPSRRRACRPFTCPSTAAPKPLPRSVASTST